MNRPSRPLTLGFAAGFAHAFAPCDHPAIGPPSDAPRRLARCTSRRAVAPGIEPCLATFAENPASRGPAPLQPGPAPSIVSAVGLTIETRLGRGWLTETFAAKLDERPVVVKRPRPEVLQAPGFTAALRVWAEQQQRVSHPNLVAVLGVEETADGPVVIAQRIDGASLASVEKALTRRKRGFQPALALAIIRDVALALQHLSAQGLCHGDLDPQDILLGYDGRAWVADPGLHALGDAARVPREANSIYRAEPEPSAAGDVYAAGLILLEMLLGQPLWTKDKMNVDAAVAAIKDFSGLGQAQPLLTERLLQLLGGCLKVLPSERITAEVLAAAVDHIGGELNLTNGATPLAELVRAAVPPPESADAPTMMVDPAETERLAQAHALRMALMEGASVAVDPDLEVKALTRAGRPPSEPRSAPLPMAILSAPRPSTVTPSAPSLKRDQAVPDVHRVAQRAQAQFADLPRRQLFWAAAGAALVLIVGVVLATRPERPPTKLVLTSEPSGAAVFANDELLGATPLERSLTLDGVVRLRFELEGFEPHGVSIGTEEGVLEYRAKLKATNAAP